MCQHLVELLLAYGANPTLPDGDGDSALSLVAGERVPGGRLHPHSQEPRS